MRPRVFPAEDKRLDANCFCEGPASMRPRVFPAEDMPQPGPIFARIACCFNEAAGIPRGRRGGRAQTTA